jgi:hypothetical protein
VIRGLIDRTGHQFSLSDVYRRRRRSGYVKVAIDEVIRSVSAPAGARRIAAILEPADDPLGIPKGGALADMVHIEFWFPYCGAAYGSEYLQFLDRLMRRAVLIAGIFASTILREEKHSDLSGVTEIGEIIGKDIPGEGQPSRKGFHDDLYRENGCDDGRQCRIARATSLLSPNKPAKLSLIRNEPSASCGGPGRELCHCNRG